MLKRPQYRLLKHCLTVFFLTVLCTTPFAQEDSTVTMTYSQFLRLVYDQHPLARQARLQEQIGNAYVLKSRGGFDPKLEGTADQKYFEDKQYYSHLNGELKVPTWFGITAKAGYELNDGVFLNPERSVPSSGLWYAGLSVPLGKGLFMDERRAELKKANIYQEVTAIEQQILMNNVLLEASYAYWEWYQAFHMLATYKEALTNGQIRFEGVKQSAILGDKPYLDTLKAGIFVQDRMINLQDAEIYYFNKKSILELYLWGDQYEPLELSENVVPMSRESFQPSPVSLKLLADKDTLIENHPKLAQSEYKIDMQRIDLRLSQENLKPDLKLKYNALSQPINGNPLAQYSVENYKWGASFSYPIFIRKARGDIALTKLEIQDMELDLDFKTEEIRYKVNTALNKWGISYDQVLLYQRTVIDYRDLLEAETRLFLVGEGSIFLVNTRERAFIEAQLKLIALETKNQLNEAKTKYELLLLD